MTNEVVNALCDFERSSVFSEREKLALRFAERMALHHQSIDDSFFHDLRRGFSAAEVIELGMMIGLFIGYGRLLAVLDLETTKEGDS